MQDRITDGIAEGIAADAALWGEPGPLRAKDLAAAFGALPKPLIGEPSDLAKRIQFFAGWFFSLSQAEPTTPASIMARKWDVLAKALVKALEKIPTLPTDGRAYNDLLGAAEELANFRHNKPPPRLKPERRTLEALPDTTEESHYDVWRVDIGIEESLESLHWLIDVVHRAKFRALQDKAAVGAPQADAYAYA